MHVRIVCMRVRMVLNCMHVRMVCMCVKMVCICANAC